MRNLPENASDSQILGYWGEVLVLHRLWDMALPATHIEEWLAPCDIELGPMRIEVKAATNCPRPTVPLRLQFKSPKADNCDFVVCVGLAFEYFHYWVIPSAAINCKTIDIMSLPGQARCQWHEYYEEWEPIRFVYNAWHDGLVALV